ncbi:hypothetical protein N9C44_00415 [bacterium]|jgi:hypothetical protein|nr:hypothetical protein [bacterium]
MPIKFQPSQTQHVKGKGKVTQNFYIKNIAKEELIKYINDGQKAKIKQKCRNELDRRGVKIDWVAKSDD